MVDGVSLYQYVRSNPAIRRDITGLAANHALNHEEEQASDPPPPADIERLNEVIREGTEAQQVFESKVRALARLRLADSKQEVKEVAAVKELLEEQRDAAFQTYVAKRMEAITMAFDVWSLDRTHLGEIKDVLFNPGLPPSVVGMTDPDGARHGGRSHAKRGTAKIIMGEGAFNSAGFLGAVLEHELFHVRQLEEGRWYNGEVDRDPKAALNEVEAYDALEDARRRFGLTEGEGVHFSGKREEYFDVLSPKLREMVKRGVFEHPWLDYTLPKDYRPPRKPFVLIFD